MSYDSPLIKILDCGNSTEGIFVYTVNCVDIATGWTEQRAAWGKRGKQGGIKAIQSIENALLFPIKGFDCDNGSEFLNWHLLRYFTQRKQPVQFTRARAYHRNDNAHIEPKTGPISDNTSDINASKNPNSLKNSINPIPPNGTAISTSSSLRSNLSKKLASVLKLSKNTIHLKRHCKDYLNLITSPKKPNKDSHNYLTPSTPLNYKNRCIGKSRLLLKKSMKLNNKKLIPNSILTKVTFYFEATPVKVYAPGFKSAIPEETFHTYEPGDILNLYIYPEMTGSVEL